jgi:hypothetical protein
LEGGRVKKRWERVKVLRVKRSRWGHKTSREAEAPF